MSETLEEREVYVAERIEPLYPAAYPGPLPATGDLLMDGYTRRGAAIHLNEFLVELRVSILLTADDLRAIADYHDSIRRPENEGQSGSGAPS